MPPQEQAALWMQLRDRMKVDWHEMTLQEKKAGTLYTLHPIRAWGKAGHLLDAILLDWPNTPLGDRCIGGEA